MAPTSSTVTQSQTRSLNTASNGRRTRIISLGRVSMAHPFLAVGRESRVPCRSRSVYRIDKSSLRNTPYKWLDIAKLCRLLLPDYQLNRLRYFTARITARPADPGKPHRQDAYLRALRTIPYLTIHEGFYLESTQRCRLVNPVAGLPATVEVFKTEEKGS